MHLPERISDEYGSLTPRAERIWVFAMLASTGKICFMYTWRVSHAGRSEGLQLWMARLCSRCVAERLARETLCHLATRVKVLACKGDGTFL
jgi:hypothetical protein